MAISAPHYHLMKSLKQILPVGGSVLQIGEANWYGDLDPVLMFGTTNLFEAAGAFYRDLFEPSDVLSFDANGSPKALRSDLNLPVPTNAQFDLVINHGTAEHIFNIAEVFRSMHDRCATGGLMIHESPFTGWIDHGFYSLHPTLFYDLAAANNYEVVLVALEVIDGCQVIRLESRDHVFRLARDGELPNNAMLFVVFRKLADAPFRIPMQGYYSRTLSEAGREAWEVLR